MGTTHNSTPEARIARLDPARRALFLRLHRQKPSVATLRPQRYPVSGTQFGMWMFDQLYPGSAAYHNPAVVALAGRVNVQALRDALADVQAHHGALRTRLIETEDGLPEQVVEPTLPLDFHESHTGPKPLTHSFVLTSCAPSTWKLAHFGAP